MNFLYTILIFITIKFLQEYSHHLNKPNKEKINLAKVELKKDMNKYEDKYNIKKAPIFHLRASTIFNQIKTNKEKNEFRENLMKKVNEIGGKPGRGIGLFIFFMLVRIVMIYIIYLFLFEPVNLFLSAILIITNIVYWLTMKRYLFLLIFTVLGVFVYSKISATVALFIMLNLLFTIIKRKFRKIKKNT